MKREALKPSVLCQQSERIMFWGCNSVLEKQAIKNKSQLHKKRTMELFQLSRHE